MSFNTRWHKLAPFVRPKNGGGADFPVATSYPSNVARGGVYGRAKCSLPGRRARDEAISGEEMGGVENRRSGVSLPVAHNAAFARVASVRLGVALFPVPAHRTEQARFAHSALGESVTTSPTES